MILTRTAATIAIAAALLTSCGGGGDDDGPSAQAGADTTTAAPSSGDTTASSGSSDVELLDADLRVRFVNVLSDSGQDSELDFGWGSYKDYEVVETLGYGEFSDVLDARVLAGDADNEAAAPGRIYLKAITRRTVAAEGVLPTSHTQVFDEGAEVILVMSWSGSRSDDGEPLTFSQWLDIDRLPEAPADKAFMYFGDTGLSHLEHDAWPGIGGSCLKNSESYVNLNQFEVDPGPIELTISESFSSECSEPMSDPVTFDAKPGHRYYVVAHGHTWETRSAVVIDLDE